MKILKAILGNYIYRLTGSTILIDKEWNAKQLKMPDSKSWFNLLVIFPVTLISFMIILAFLLS